MTEEWSKMCAHVLCKKEDACSQTCSLIVDIFFFFSEILTIPLLYPFNGL